MVHHMVLYPIRQHLEMDTPLRVGRHLALERVHLGLVERKDLPLLRHTMRYGVEV